MKGRGLSGLTVLARSLVALVLLLGAAGLAACGGLGEEATPEVAAGDADVGKVVEVDDWQVELLGPAEKAKIIGTGSYTYQADGIYLIVPVKVTNLGADIRMMPRDLMKAVDGQGKAYNAVAGSKMIAHLLVVGNQEVLVDNPFTEAGGRNVRESIIMFDVPEGASGFVLTLMGSEETFKVGF